MDGRPDAFKVVRKAIYRKVITPENLMSFDFFLIPHLERETHYKLLGIGQCFPLNFLSNLNATFIYRMNESRLNLIAPKRKEFFVVDSVESNLYSGMEIHSGTLLTILNHLVPDDRDREQWDVNFDYIDEDEEKSTAERQKDIYNCGVFTCTNAILLAFGYDLKCYKRRDLDKFRKRRTVAEFRNGGFNGLYNYDLIEVPPPKRPTCPTETYRKAMEDNNYIIEKEDSDVFSDSDNDEVEQSSEINDDTEARGLEHIESTVQGGIINTTSLSPRTIFPTASQCLVRDIPAGVIRPDSLDRSMPA